MPTLHGVRKRDSHLFGLRELRAPARGAGRGSLLGLCLLLISAGIGGRVVAAVARPDRDSRAVFAAPLTYPMAASGRIALQSGVFLPVGGLAGNLERVRGSVSAGSPVRVLLRFSTVPGAEERRALAEAGAALFQSLGNGVFFAEIAPGADEVLLEGAG